MPHCSINRLFLADTIEMTIAIFTSPLDLVSHQFASALRPASDSESPASKTIVGQSSSRGRHLGLYVESPSLEEFLPKHLPAPREYKLRFGRPILRRLSLTSSASAICDASFFFESMSLMINRSVRVMCHPSMLSDISTLMIYLNKVIFCDTPENNVLLIYATSYQRIRL